jgi:transcriptional regulator GlxA family with amidase domain
VKTAILVLDAVLDSSLALTQDVLFGANRLLTLAGKRPLFEVELVSTASPVTSGCGMRLEVARKLGSRAYELVFAPGLNLPMPRELVARLEQPDISLATRWLARQHAGGARIAGACVGTFLLAEAGLLDGKRATTSWWLAGEFARRYPTVKLEADQMVTRSGRIWCGGAALAQMDVVLAVVAELAGPRIAHLVARYLVIERRPTQARYALASHLAIRHEDVEAAEAWIRGHVAVPFGIETLAKGVGVSPRTLARRIHVATGVSPLRFVQRVRAEQAIHLLETTRQSVEEIAERVGYQNGSTLRRLLRRETGTSPRELRTRARSA